MRLALAISLGVWVVLAVVACLAFGMLAKTRYREGWFQGRLAMMLSLREAQQRGMSVDEWLEGEVARDVSRLLHPEEFSE